MKAAPPQSGDAASGENVTPLRAGHSQDAFCDEFLARHSDYLDGLMPPLEAARMSGHAEACAACSRYDRIVRKGLVLARELPEPAVSDDFELRLQHRLLQVGNGVGGHPGAAFGIAATLGVAAALALVAWSPLLLDRAGTDGAAPAAMELDADDGSFGAPPLLVEDAWYPVSAPLPTYNAAAVLATLPGPYSPLIVTPPAHRTVRVVSSESAGID